MVYEVVVSRGKGVSGSLVIDVEAGGLEWQPAGLEGEENEVLPLGSTAEAACGECLTWEGARSLPFRVNNENLLGAMPTSSSGFEVLYSTSTSTTSKEKKKRILRSEAFLCTDVSQAEECIEKIRSAASGGGCHERKRILVILNPCSGQGKGKRLWEKKVRGWFDASGLGYTFRETEAPGDARDLARNVDFDVFDALVIIGGDGTLHEVCNGLFRREDSERAKEVALGMVPTGSGNGFAASVGSRNVDTALWAILKNKRSPMDIVSVLQPQPQQQQHKRWFMCLTTTFGFIADLDLNTEHLRFLGGVRFTLGGIYQILRGRTTKAAVAFVSKEAAGRMGRTGGGHLDELKDKASDNLLRELPEQWTLMEYDDFQFFVCANTPCMSMGDRVAPTADVSSGSLVMVSTKRNSRMKNISLMDAVANGTTHESPLVSYKEVVAFVIEPQCDHFQFSLDGERIPLGRLFGEVHAGLGTCFCPNKAF